KQYTLKWILSLQGADSKCKAKRTLDACITELPCGARQINCLFALVRLRGPRLLASGLATEVGENILQKQCTSKWRLSLLGVDSDCKTQSAAQLVQFWSPMERFSARPSPSTLKVHVAALAAYHTLLGGQSLGRHPSITRLLHGTGLQVHWPPVYGCQSALDLEYGSLQGLLSGKTFVLRRAGPFRTHQALEATILQVKCTLTWASKPVVY
ncbi:hypothetical protein M9458_029202, partial [Cirrhinus mrigala]